MPEEVQVPQDQALTASPTLDVAVDEDEGKSIARFNPSERLSDSRHEAFAQWLAMPDDERAVQTQKGFGLLKGISEQSLCKWRKRPEIQARVEFLVAAVAKLAEVALKRRSLKIVNAIADKAEDGDVPAAKLCLDRALPVAPSVAVQVNQNQTITFEQALKENGESWEPPTWAGGQVIDVPVEPVTEPVAEEEVKGEEDETAVR